MDPPGRLPPLARAAGILSLVAGGVHGAVTPAHFAEWWGYGMFFVAAGLAQMVMGIAVLTRAVNPRDTGPSWRSWTRRMYVAGIVGNVAIIGLYVVTRTVGIPWFGPEAGAVEEVALVDVLSKAAELALVVVLVVLLARERDADQGPAAQQA